MEPISRKQGIFLGYVPHTTLNILWDNSETPKIKIATHACFDKGMNDLPVTDMPPDVAHLVRTNDGQPIQPDITKLSASIFAFDIVLFVPLFNGWLKQSDLPNNPTFGLTFEDDPILHCMCLSPTLLNAWHCLLSAPCIKSNSLQTPWHIHL